MTTIEDESLKLVMDILIGQRKLAAFQHKINEAVKGKKYEEATELQAIMKEYVETLPKFERLEELRKDLDNPHRNPKMLI